MPDQSKTPILSALQASSQRPHAAFYAPGHKRGQGASTQLINLLGEKALAVDLPELPELDNLFAPEGVIYEAQELAAAAFGAEQTYFLANGSTCGIEATILATVGPGDKIIVPRNAHRSVIAGLVLSGAMPVFVAPEYSPELGLVLGVKAETIAAALSHHPDTRAVLLVSPTYHGLCSDVGAIAALAHSHNIPLLIDEAHGPHFAFHPELPTPALALGADLVVQSTHKVLGALSQAAMLHTRGDRIDRSRLQSALQLTQSTSPNSLLLASLDAARHQIATAGKALLSDTLDLTQQIRRELAEILGLRVIDKSAVTSFSSVSDLDLTRLTVDLLGVGITGLEADDILHHELGVTVELPELRHLTLIVSLGNTEKDVQRCVAGFETLAAGAGDRATHHAPIHWPETGFAEDGTPTFGVPLVSPREAFFTTPETVSAQAAIGRLSAETISAYPPGIPTIVAGEPISAADIQQLTLAKQQGGYVTGGRDASLDTFHVLTVGKEVK
ncbi:arginine decarboxylase [filamentous cyanobacterium CCT1]|nr:arginine decarboxylase [filamentous cyanobacterium CCT1]PSN79825.1 arginine decarboxylase [filamentous cyanobacterium CCP4]